MYSTSTYRSADAVNSAMGRVYGHMGLAVVTSMIVSYLVGSSPSLLEFFFTGIMQWIVIFSPLVAIFALMAGVERMSKTGLQLFLHGFAALMGLSFATIFAVYNIGSIVSAFMGAAVLFGVMSFYGYFTKKDLTGLGSLLFVGLIAIIIASVINLLLANFMPGAIDNVLVSTVISAIGVIVFLGLTAYDTQKIRELVSVGGDTGKEEVLGALSLYLDFINLFLLLLQLFGERK